MTIRRETYSDLIALAQTYVKAAEADAAINPTSDYIQVVIVEPNKTPYIKTIPNTLECFNEIVGGYIENVFLTTTTKKGAQLGLIVNEEGKLKQLPFNRKIVSFDIIVGTFFITAYNKQGDHVSLTNEEAERIVKRFKGFEVYL